MTAPLGGDESLASVVRARPARDAGAPVATDRQGDR